MTKYRPPRPSKLKRLGLLFEGMATIAFFMMLAGFGVLTFWHAERGQGYMLSEIQIDSSGTLTEADVRGILDLRRPVRLLKLDIAKIEEMLESDSRVKSARVIRELPDILRLELTEREATYAVQLQDETLWAVDADGYRLQNLKKTEQPFLIRDMIGLFSATGKTLGDNWVNVRATISAYEQRFPETHLKEVKIAGKDLLILIPTEGPLFKLSFRGEEDLKKLDIFLSAVPDHGAFEYMDLRFRDVVVKMREKI